jgi:putative membrane protein
MSRFILFLKGIAMGTADVIPGVSGGTLALILGIYGELVDTIKGVRPHLLLYVFRWLAGGRKPEDLDIVRAEWKHLNFEFLIALVAGIATAIVAGSSVIPMLMENYPVAMRALFFGLIVASVIVPMRMISFKTPAQISIVALCITLGAAFGFTVTNPANSYDMAREWTTVTSEGESLKDVTRRGPSGMSSEQVFWTEKNQALRDSVAQSEPAKFAELTATHEAQLQPVVDKDVLKARSKPYDEVMISAGTPVQVPRPTIWFVFIAGVVAICAMILPGISGSYILLILGVYFFILNALKGFLSTLAHGHLPVTQASYVIVFVLGCLVGILSFARVLSYLLHRHGGPTLAVLVGLMVGCLRGIWPFRQLVNEVEINVIPTALDANVGIAVGCGLLGVAIVAAFSWLGRVKEEGETANA